MTAPKKVTILQGIPGSGKSTWAKAQVSASVARINNDDIATMLWGDPWAYFGPDRGEILRKARLGMLAMLLKSPAIEHVIVDNTNLISKTVREIATVAHDAGAEVVLKQDFLDTPLSVCLQRNADRILSVEPTVIRDMYNAIPRARRIVLPEPLVVIPYEPLIRTAPVALVVDIDGTVALMGERSPYDWHRVGEDKPNIPVIRVVRTMANRLLPEWDMVFFLSGRDEVCRAATTAWLDQHVTGRCRPDVPHTLLMRPKGDTRRDAVVKHELFHAHIQGKYNVRAVFDDRDQVVRLWRQMGLPTFQVADGAF